MKNNNKLFGKGIIYKRTESNGKVCMGIAYYLDQKPTFVKYKKVFMYVCDENANFILDKGKKVVTLKHITQLERIGMVD